jgi:hypothetical protein
VKFRIVIALLILSLALNALLLVTVRRALSRAEDAGGPPPAELAPYMATLQHQAHKLGLSIQARNRPLAGFYLDEVEETAEIIAKTFPLYDHVHVAELVDAMFAPSLPPLVKALESEDWPAADRAYDALIGACNDCHGAADREYIEIVVPSGNPFNQTFSPGGNP